MREQGTVPLYNVVGLTVTFATERGPLHAVRGVDLEIHAGTVVGLVGESGSGKSVTAQALLRLLPPHAQFTAPRLSFDGEDIVTMRPAGLQRLRGGRVGMIFQEPARSFDPIYSIERSLAETLHTHRPELDPEALHARSVALLEEVGIAEAERRLASFPHQFSGGMLQRVMIAHALAADPDVLIADEPTTALDVTVQAQVVELLLRLRAARGLAILFISHDLALVGQIADRLVVMYGGLVMEQGPAAAVLHAPRHPYTRALLDAHLPLGVHYTEQPLHAIPGTVPDPLHPEPGCPFAPRCALAETRCSRAIPPLVDERVEAANTGWKAGGPIPSPTACRPPPYFVRRGAGRPHHPPPLCAAGDQGERRGRYAAGGGPMLSLDAVSKRFALKAGYFAAARRHVYAVREVSLRVAAGETYGLVGESGSGKTTTARLAVGMYRPDSGAITYRDRDGYLHHIGRSGSRARRELRTRLAYVFQDPARSLNPRMRVESILLAGLRYTASWRGAEDGRSRALAALEAVGLAARHLSRRPPDFSGGQRQRVAIARALIAQPETIICDEIVSALDVSIRSQILDLLQRLRRDLGLTLLFISHDLAVVTYFCDRVGVMQGGRLVEEAPARELATNPRHRYTQRLYAAVPKLPVSG